jgi:outer membrane protein assembly factor BamB
MCTHAIGTAGLLLAMVAGVLCTGPAIRADQNHRQALWRPSATGGNVPLTSSASAGTLASGPPTKLTLAVAMAVDRRNGDVLVLRTSFDGGTLAAVGRAQLTVLLATASGLQLGQSVTLGIGAEIIALDEQSERAFVANVGTGPRFTGVAQPPIVGGSVSILDLQALERPVPAGMPVLRTLSLGDRVPLAMAVSVRTGRVFVATHRYPWEPRGKAGQVLMLDGRTGRILHSAAIGLLPTDLAIDDTTGRVFVAGESGDGDAGRMVMLDANTGIVLRSSAVVGIQGRLAVDQSSAHLFWISDYPGRVVQMCSTRAGTCLRTIPLDQPPMAIAVDGRRDHVLVALSAGLEQGAVVLLDGRTGNIVGRVPAGGPIVLPIDAIRPASLVVDEQTGRVLVASARVQNPAPTVKVVGTLFILDAQWRDLTLVRRRDLRATATAVAVDGARGRLLVLMQMLPAAGTDPAGVGVLDIQSGAERAYVELPSGERPSP